ncbi:MAG: GumC family protein, partial [Beijerinckiaceae bacterium]
MLTPNPQSRLFTRQDDQGLAALFDPIAALNTVRRQWPVIAACAIAILGLAIGYILTTTPRYTATASIMIDTRKNQMFQTQQVPTDAPMDSSAVDSQVEILKSESVALAVIRELKLLEDPEFSGSDGSSLFGTLFSIFGSGAPSQTQAERRALTRFARSIQIKRVGLSYVIDISFTSTDRAKAALIANAIGEAYMTGELDARYQATRRASRWLQERISELRTQASEADSAVQKFKSENNIVDTGRGLMSEQQLSDVNTQLVTSRAATAEAKARLDRIEDIANGDVPDATVADALRNEVITRLRAQFLDLSAREAEWSVRYGANHNAVANLRNQMREIKRSISDELRRIAQTYRSDYEIAKARESSLETSLSSLVGQAALTGQAQIRLRDLESSAQTYRNLYDNFLQRFMEATQQQSFPISEARFITAATPPLNKSWPRTTLILPAALLAGVLLGVAAAFGRERMDNVFRTVVHVEEATGIECLGVLPFITDAGAPDYKTAQHKQRILSADLGLYRYVVSAPFARFTETLRTAKISADTRIRPTGARVIGIASALPNEGKTTVASNFAQMVADSGQRVL